MEFLLLLLVAGAIIAWWIGAAVRERRGDEFGFYRATAPAEPSPSPERPLVAAQSLPAGEIRWKLRPQAQGFSIPFGVVEDVGQSLRRVPPLSHAMIRILRELGSQESNAQSVAEILGDEPVLTAALLRMANSAAVGLRREIVTVPEAVAYLGFSTTKSLLLRLHLGSLMGAGMPGVGYDGARLWVHAMAVAHVSEELARAAGGDPDLALTAGLLHDIGKIAINTQFPQRVAELLSAGSNTAAGMLDLERQAFGADHAVLGGQLASQWALPGGLVDVIRLHHSVDALPGMLPPQTRRTLLCVHVANQLVKQCHAYCDCVELDPVSPQVTDELGLPRGPQRLIDANVEAALRRVFQINGIPLNLPRGANKAA